MYPLLIALLAFQAATVIDVYAQSRVTIALQICEVIYTAEFSPQEFKHETVREGDQLQAEVQGTKLTVHFKDGKTVTAPIIRVQRTLIHPLP